jgi:ribonuclease D
MDNPCRIYKQRYITFLEFSTNARKVCLQIKVAYNAADVDAWIDANVGDVVGFDIEWRPNRCKWQNNLASLMQISAGDRVLLIRLMYLPMTERLARMLGDSGIKKVGVGIQGDATKMLKDWGVRMSGLVDMLNSPGCRSLKAVTDAVIGVKLTKNKLICMSNWERQSFTRAQVIYAALDAWVGGECYCVLMQNQVKFADIPELNAAQVVCV